MTSIFRALLFSIAVAAQARGAEPAYRVIVNPSNEIATVDRKFLADAFLKKSTRWPDGKSIRPVDLAQDTVQRRKFSQDVLGRTVSAISSYWQQSIFSGRDVPPPELDSDKDVVDFVLKHPGAIGYVSATADVRDAKVVAIR